MKFVEELARMDPPEKPKSQDQLRYERYLEQAHWKVKQQCTKDRVKRQSSGYLVLAEGMEYFDSDDVACSPKLYAHEYPYKIDIGRQIRFTKSKGLQLQLYNPFGAGDGYSGVRPIGTTSAFCDRLVGGLRELLRQDGFVRVELATVPVHSAEVKRYCKSHLFDSLYFEEGRLTSRVEGYVILFEVAW